MLLAPASEWAVIDREPPDLLGIYKNHIAPLVVFYALCGLIGGLLFGVGFLRLRPPIMTLVGDTLVTVVIHLLMVQIFALVVEALAPWSPGTSMANFAGHGDGQRIWTRETLDRLGRVKKAVDPGNLFGGALPSTAAVPAGAR